MSKNQTKFGDKNFCSEVAEFYQQCLIELADLEESVTEEVNVDEFDSRLDRLDERLAEIYDRCFLLTPKEMKKIIEAGLRVPEYLKIRANLESDFNNNQETLEFFGLVDNLGNYQADYNGLAENHRKSSDFRETKFQLPQIQDIMAAFKPEQLKLYQYMEREGMRPSLQVSPIGYSRAKLMDKFAEKKDSFVDANGRKLLRDIKMDDFNEEKDLRYGENVGMPSPGGSRGQSKSQWIKENHGFQVNIIATKPWIDSAIKSEMWSLSDQQRSMTAGQLIQKSGKRFKELGFCGLTLETNLVALMNEYRTGEITTKDTQQFLLDNVKPSADSTPSCGHTWMDIMMGGYILDSGRDTMWVRPAIRIRMEKPVDWRKQTGFWKRDLLGFK